MKTLKTLLVLNIFILFIGCNKSAENAKTIIPILISKGSLMGSENILQQNLVMYNNVSWNAILNSIDTFRLAGFAETRNVDFNNFQIIAVFDKVYGNPTNTIDITYIRENSDNIVVTLKIQKIYAPVVVTVMDQKFHIIKIPKSSKPVIFQTQ